MVYKYLITYEDMHFGAPEILIKYAKQLRRNQTPAEAILWQAIRNRKLLKTKFRRQHPLSFYIVDFYCVKLKLSIELDGGIHNRPEVTAYDQNRTTRLSDLGITELRFTNEVVLDNLEYVLKEIKKEIYRLQEK